MNHVFIMPLAFKFSRLGVKDLSIRCSSSKKTLSTFYDTLNLKPGCTKKEIRNSFIRLSKLNHPDVCGPSSNDKFIRINEAYNILIDDNKKNLYNKTLIHNDNTQPVYYYHYPKQQERNWKNDFNHPNNHWLSSNITIAGFCIAVLFIGSIMRFYGVKKSTFIRSLLMEESDECLSFLEEQKLMKIDKNNDELIKMFETNIAKEYGQIIKK